MTQQEVGHCPLIQQVHQQVHLYLTELPHQKRELITYN